MRAVLLLLVYLFVVVPRILAACPESQVLGANSCDVTTSKSPWRYALTALEFVKEHQLYRAPWRTVSIGTVNTIKRISLYQSVGSNKQQGVVQRFLGIAPDNNPITPINNSLLALLSKNDAWVATDEQLVESGADTYLQLLAYVHPEIAAKVKGNTLLLSMFAGVKPEIRSDMLGFPVLTAAEKKELSKLIDTDPHYFSFILPNGEISILNVQAASRTVVRYPQVFPPQAAKNPTTARTWLRYAYYDWRDGESPTNTIRRSVLQGASPFVAVSTQLGIPANDTAKAERDEMYLILVSDLVKQRTPEEARVSAESRVDHIDLNPDRELSISGTEYASPKARFLAKYLGWLIRNNLVSMILLGRFGENTDLTHAYILAHAKRFQSMRDYPERLQRGMELPGNQDETVIIAHFPQTEEDRDSIRASGLWVPIARDNLLFYDTNAYRDFIAGQKVRPVYIDEPVLFRVPKSFIGYMAKGGFQDDHGLGVYRPGSREENPVQYNRTATKFVQGGSKFNQVRMTAWEFGLVPAHLPVTAIISQEEADRLIASGEVKQPVPKIDLTDRVFEFMLPVVRLVPFLRDFTSEEPKPQTVREEETPIQTYPTRNDIPQTGKIVLYGHQELLLEILPELEQSKYRARTGTDTRPFLVVPFEELHKHPDLYEKFADILTMELSQYSDAWQQLSVRMKEEKETIAEREYVSDALSQMKYLASFRTSVRDLFGSDTAIPKANLRQAVTALDEFIAIWRPQMEQRLKDLEVLKYIHSNSDVSALLDGTNVYLDGEQMAAVESKFPELYQVLKPYYYRFSVDMGETTMEDPNMHAVVPISVIRTYFDSHQAQVQDLLKILADGLYAYELRYPDAVLKILTSNPDRALAFLNADLEKIILLEKLLSAFERVSDGYHSADAAHAALFARGLIGMRNDILSTKESLIVPTPMTQNVPGNIPDNASRASIDSPDQVQADFPYTNFLDYLKDRLMEMVLPFLSSFDPFILSMYVYHTSQPWYAVGMGAITVAIDTTRTLPQNIASISRYLKVRYEAQMLMKLTDFESKHLTPSKRLALRKEARKLAYYHEYPWLLRFNDQRFNDLERIGKIMKYRKNSIYTDMIEAVAYRYLVLGMPALPEPGYDSSLADPDQSEGIVSEPTDDRYAVLNEGITKYNDIFFGDPEIGGPVTDLYSLKYGEKIAFINKTDGYWYIFTKLGNRFGYPTGILESSALPGKVINVTMNNNPELTSVNTYGQSQGLLDVKYGKVVFIGSSIVPVIPNSEFVILPKDFDLTTYKPGMKSALSRLPEEGSLLLKLSNGAEFNIRRDSIEVDGIRMDTVRFLRLFDTRHISEDSMLTLVVGNSRIHITTEIFIRNIIDQQPDLIRYLLQIHIFLPFGMDEFSASGDRQLEAAFQSIHRESEWEETIQQIHKTLIKWLAILGGFEYEQSYPSHMNENVINNTIQDQRSDSTTFLISELENTGIVGERLIRITAGEKSVRIDLAVREINGIVVEQIRNNSPPMWANEWNSLDYASQSRIAEELLKNNIPAENFLNTKQPHVVPDESLKRKLDITSTSFDQGITKKEYPVNEKTLFQWNQIKRSQMLGMYLYDNGEVYRQPFIAMLGSRFWHIQSDVIAFLTSPGQWLNTRMSGRTEGFIYLPEKSDTFTLAEIQRRLRIWDSQDGEIVQPEQDIPVPQRIYEAARNTDYGKVMLARYTTTPDRDHPHIAFTKVYDRKTGKIISLVYWPVETNQGQEPPSGGRKDEDILLRSKQAIPVEVDVPVNNPSIRERVTDIASSLKPIRDCIVDNGLGTGLVWAADGGMGVVCPLRYWSFWKTFREILKSPVTTAYSADYAIETSQNRLMAYIYAFIRELALVSEPMSHALFAPTTMRHPNSPHLFPIIGKIMVRFDRIVAVFEGKTILPGDAYDTAAYSHLMSENGSWYLKNRFSRRLQNAYITRKKGESVLLSRIVYAIKSNPDISESEIRELFEWHAYMYGFTPSDWQKISAVFSQYRRMRMHVLSVLSTYPDPADLYTALFGVSPQNPELVKVDKRYLGLALTCSDVDYKYAIENNMKFRWGIPMPGMSEKSTGAVHFETVQIPGLEEAVILTPLHDPYKYESFFISFLNPNLIHEENHTMNSFFQISQSLLTSDDLMGWVKEIGRIEDVGERRTAIRKFVETDTESVMDRYKDEILAYFLSGTDRNEIEKYLFKKLDENGLYDYNQEDYRIYVHYFTSILGENIRSDVESVAREELLTGVNESQVKATVSRAIDVLFKGYDYLPSRQRIGMFFINEELDAWPKVAGRMHDSSGVRGLYVRLRDSLYEIQRIWEK